jgi:hypothetical protein
MITMTIDGKEYQLTPITQEKKLVIKREFTFEIHPDELGKMTWDEAIEKVSELGDGWRLPTITELQLIWESGHKDLFKKEWYWSSLGSYPINAWGFYFYNGYSNDSSSKYNYGYVRAVRDLTI